jgi:nucleotide-binding universal stress UspA family protein
MATTVESWPVPEASRRHLDEDNAQPTGHEVIPAAPEEGFRAGAVPRHLLVCLDRSPAGEQLIRHAAALAEAWSARVTVMHVLELESDGGSLSPVDAVQWRLRRQESRQFLANAASLPARGNLRIETELGEGRVFEQIQAWTNSHEVDLTILATHGERARTVYGLAGTSYKLIDGLPGSLLVVPTPESCKAEAEEFGYRHILVPLDGSLHAASVLPMAAQLAEAGGSEIILAHVVPEPGLVRFGPPQAEDLELEQSMIRRNEKVAGAYLASIRAQLQSAKIKVRTYLSLKENPRDELLRIIEDENIDLVVMSAHGSTGATDRALGSVATHLVAHAKAPLLLSRNRTTCTAHWDRASTVSRSVRPRLPGAAAA